MGQDTQRMSRDIEGTRDDLSRNLDALSDKVSPSRMVERRVQRARGGLSRMRDKVMGSAQGVGDSASSVGSTVSDAASSTAETVREKAEGNPLAAGLIAFGAGWLLSSMMPASQKETEMAGKLVDVAKEQGQPIAREAAQVGREMGGTLKEKATEAAQDVRSSAEDSAKHVADEARS